MVVNFPEHIIATGAISMIVAQALMAWKIQELSRLLNNGIVQEVKSLREHCIATHAAEVSKEPK